MVWFTCLLGRILIGADHRCVGGTDRTGIEEIIVRWRGLGVHQRGIRLSLEVTRMSAQTKGEKVFRGIAVSSGVCRGKILVLHRVRHLIARREIAAILEQLHVGNVIPPAEFLTLRGPGIHYRADLIGAKLRQGEIMPRREAYHPADAGLCRGSEQRRRANWMKG